MVLEHWLQKEHYSEKKILEYQKKFMHNIPFSHIEIENFFLDKKIAVLLKALKQEEFLEKESDLFKFMQSHDFATTKNKILQELRAFLSSKEFILYLERITGLKLKEGSIDISASLYQNTDYLLPHDDKLENRKIAFMLYLSTLQSKDGGKLILYKTKGSIPKQEETAIIPKTNSFVFFKVTEKSFHEVEEILTNTQRITIGGWFHDTHKSHLYKERNY